MIIQKGATVWYWPTDKSPSPLNKMLGKSLQAIIYKVASTGAGNSFAAVRGTTLDINVQGIPNMLRGVPIVVGTPTAENLISTGFCTTRPYIPPPAPITFDQALIQLKNGKTISRPGVSVSPADAAAADWVPC